MKALITGASKGIGFSILKRLINNGLKCTVILRNPESIQNNPEYSNVNVLKCNLDNRNDLNQILKTISQESYSVLINNAGGGVPCKFEDIEIEQIDYEYNLNFISPMFLIKAVLPKMRENSYGRIINISSISSKRGTPYLFYYSAAKAGINSLTQSLAKYLANTGITINSICPGGVETEMSVEGRKLISQLSNMSPHEYQNNMMKNMGIGRLIYPDEVASLVSFLLESSSITGQSINICGSLEVY